MTKKKIKPLILTLDPSNYPFTKVTAQLPGEQKRRFKKAINEQIRGLKYHFKKYGWDLDWEMIKDEVMALTFGAGLTTHILARVMTETNTCLVLKDGSPCLQKRSHDRKNRSKKRT